MPGVAAMRQWVSACAPRSRNLLQRPLARELSADGPTHSRVGGQPTDFRPAADPRPPIGSSGAVLRSPPVAANFATDGRGRWRTGRAKSPPLGRRQRQP